MFKCRGCEAKDEEIRHLLALLDKAQAATEKAQARVVEIASPGAERRVALTAAPEQAGPIRRVSVAVPTGVGFPGYTPQPRPAPIEVEEPAG